MPDNVNVTANDTTVFATHAFSVLNMRKYKVYDAPSGPNNYANTLATYPDAWITPHTNHERFYDIGFVNWTSFCDPSFTVPCTNYSIQSELSIARCNLLVKRWHCDDKVNDGKLETAPETDFSWPFGYKGFFAFGERYRFRVRVDTGYGRGIWSNWSSNTYPYDAKANNYNDGEQKRKYSDNALKDASQWTLFRPYFNINAKLVKINPSQYSMKSTSGPGTPPYIPNANNL